MCVVVSEWVCSRACVRGVPQWQPKPQTPTFTLTQTLTLVQTISALEAEGSYQAHEELSQFVRCRRAVIQGPHEHLVCVCVCANACGYLCVRVGAHTACVWVSVCACAGYAMRT